MATKQAYGICKCGKWGPAPDRFRENLHFLLCACGRTMNLIRSDPREAGYREDNKIQPGYVKQEEAI